MPVSRNQSVALLAILLVSMPSLASGQGFGIPNPFQSPAPGQVFQRDEGGMADVPLVFPENLKDAKIISISDRSNVNLPVRLVDGKLMRVPAGGPYLASIVIESGGQLYAGPFYVGDLWVLAGQSNMQGVGDLQDVTTPHLKVSALGMNGKWTQATEPLHWLEDSPDPVHSGDPATRAERSKKEHATRTKGAGLGLPFGSAMADQTQVPVGLVLCAHGGTNMDQWSPSKKGEGGGSLYGSMLRQVKLAGGKVKGVLWYQGESDGMVGQAVADAYSKKFAAFIAAVRDDFGQADLPFYYVQIGRFVNNGDPKPWNTVQEAQRKLAETVPHTALVSVIDLPLDDGIHVGTAGLKRVGERLAKVAIREHFGLLGGTTPTLDRVVKGHGGTLVVKFKGVNRTAYSTVNGSYVPNALGGLQPERHVAGFSLRKADGKEVPLIYEAMVNASRDAVILKLNGALPEGTFLWYGWGLDPYCNLTDTLDMAVTTFGPVVLDSIK